MSLMSSSLFAQVPSNGLMAWYKFNGNAGDSSGNGNHGTVNGAILTSDRFSNNNGAYQFNGSGDYISIPASNSIQPNNALSVSVWFYSDNNANQWQPIVCKFLSNSFPYNSYYLGTGTPSPVNGKWYGVISDGASVSQNAISKTTTTNSWILLTFTYDGSSINTYVNGVLESTNSFSGNIGYTSGALYVAYDGLAGQYFKGKVDEITIYNRALSQTEISNMYNNTNASIPAISNSQQDIAVYPNPFENFINIANAGAGKISSELYDLAGKLILTSDESRISTENLSRGFYFLSIKSEDKVITTKIQKN